MHPKLFIAFIYSKHKLSKISIHNQWILPFAMHWTNWFGRMLNVSLAAICWCTRTMKSIVSIIDEFRKRLRSFFPSRPEAVAVQSATSYRRRDEFSSLVAKCDHECWTCPKAAKAFTIKKKNKMLDHTYTLHRDERRYTEWPMAISRLPTVLFVEIDHHGPDPYAKNVAAIILVWIVERLAQNRIVWSNVVMRL